jgi:hypothetical protein
LGRVFGSRAARRRSVRERRGIFRRGFAEADSGCLFRESYFPSEWNSIKEWFETIRATFEPDLVFTHYRNDRHQDHRVLSDLTWNTFRNHLILEYEILKYDGDLGSLNVFVPLSEEAGALKVKLLLKHFQSQRAKHWFTGDTFEAMQRIRGVESASSFHQSGICNKDKLAAILRLCTTWIIATAGMDKPFRLCFFRWTSGSAAALPSPLKRNCPLFTELPSQPRLNAAVGSMP